MHYAAPVVLFAGLAAAQSNVVKIVSVPKSFEVGQEAVVGWSTTDTTDPIEIVVKEPDASNTAVYDPNPIGTVVSGANPTVSSVTFTPTAGGSSLALEILQAGQTNYYGPFNINGGATTAASSYASSAASSSASSASSYASSVTASASSSIITSSSALSYNATTSFASNATTSVPGGPASVKPTSISPPQNSTFTTATTAGTTGTKSSGSGASATTSVPLSAPSSGAAGLASPLALALGVVAALAYLA
ncbi:MAG: hypothetical protein M1822_000094 [Bathelium mastoideum]|nr:MAG: hypothetical protein M1822_000094 [Bathelium mastoideum]